VVFTQRLHTEASLEQPPKKRLKRQDSSFRASDSPAPSDVKSFTPLPLDESSLRKDTAEALRSLIFSPTPFPPGLPPKDRLPGSFIALDCEMVGVGPMGAESTLARISVVNYFGAVLVDEFVRQKERVTDWRTQWSGVRAKDMINGDYSHMCISRVFGLTLTPSKDIRGGTGHNSRAHQRSHCHRPCYSERSQGMPAGLGCADVCDFLARHSCSHIREPKFVTLST